MRGGGEGRFFSSPVTQSFQKIDWKFGMLKLQVAPQTEVIKKTI